MAHFNQDQATFLISVSKQTGIDPRVIASWMWAEGAFRKGGTGGYNYLNLRPFSGDKSVAVSSGGFSQFANAQDAANATVAVLHQPNMALILNTAKTKPTPAQEIHAIHLSPWSSDGYGQGGINLLKSASYLFGNGIFSDHYVDPGNAQSIAAEMGQSASDWTSFDMGDLGKAAESGGEAAANKIGQVAHDLASPFESLASFFKWLGNNWDRVLFVAGGAILVIIALLLVANSAKSNVMSFKSGGE